MDINEVKAYLEQNKEQDEVKGFIATLRTPGVDDFKAAAESNEDVKRIIQSIADARVTGAIKTYEEKTLPQKLREHEELVKKQFKQPEETPEQKELRELKEAFAASERKATQAALKTFTLSSLAQEGLSAELADYAMGQDEEGTKQRIASLKKLITSEIERKVTETLGSAPPPPKGGNGGQGQPDLDKMSMEDYAKWFQNRKK